VTAVHYLGDEGGIICGSTCKNTRGPRGVLASITNLEFDPRQPFAAKSPACPKHRTKRLPRHAA
jgi:hypothetical protein